jgi:hypothetical protein
MEDGCKVYGETASAETRLNEMGLRPDILRNAVQYGVSYASSCTENDPPMLAGIEVWGKTMRSLRDQLLPAGWRRDNSRNYATVIDPADAFAVAVAGGNGFTGLADRTPYTRTEKGPVTRQAVLQNQGHFADIDAEFAKVSPRPASEMRTWLLMYFVDEEADEIRIELSLPAFMSREGFVTAWLERIILSPMDRSAQAAIESPDQPSTPIEIAVTKKATG